MYDLIYLGLAMHRCSYNSDLRFLRFLSLITTPLTQNRILVGTRPVCLETPWLVKNLAFEIMFQDILNPIGAIKIFHRAERKIYHQKQREEKS